MHKLVYKIRNEKQREYDRNYYHNILKVKKQKPNIKCNIYIVKIEFGKFYLMF